MSFFQEIYPRSNWASIGQSNSTTPETILSEVKKVQMVVTAKIIGKAYTWTYPFDDGKLYEVPTCEFLLKGIDQKGKELLKSFEAMRFGITRKSSEDSTPYTVGLAEDQTHMIKQWLPEYVVHSSVSEEKGAWQVYGNFLIHDGPDNPSSKVGAYASLGCVEICGSPKGFDLFNDTLIAFSGVSGEDRTAKLINLGNSRKLSVFYEKAERPPVKVG